jgi:hypothetical protein
MTMIINIQVQLIDQHISGRQCFLTAYVFVFLDERPMNSSGSGRQMGSTQLNRPTSNYTSARYPFQVVP